MSNREINKVLIVDDDENTLASMRRMFRSHFETITTCDPVQALKIFQLQGPFAVVISDFQMPVMNGIQLFSAIYALDKDVQRIMLTGHANLQMAIDAVNQGKITVFLTKPTPPESFRAVVLDAVKIYNQNRFPDQSEAGPGKKGLQAGGFSPGIYTALTVKEKEVLALLAKGFSNEEISQELYITVGTAKSHINNLFSKMGVNNRTKAVTKALEMGLIKG